MERLLILALAGAAILLVSSRVFGVYPSPHRVHDVQITNFVFAPDELTVTAGDVVRWTDAAGTHTATSAGGVWDSPDLRAGEAFEREFAEPGEYAYHCRIHTFMRGRILVAPVDPLRVMAFQAIAAIGACVLAMLIFRSLRAGSGHRG